MAGRLFVAPLFASLSWAQPVNLGAEPDWAEPLRRFILDAGGVADVHVIKDVAGGLGRGLAASRDARAGEELVLVPYKRTMSWDTLSKRAKEAVVAVVHDHYGVKQGDVDFGIAVRDTGLIASLLHERLRERLQASSGRSESPWDPYLDSLPEKAPPNWPSWPEEWRKGFEALAKSRDFDLRSDVGGMMERARRLAQFYEKNTKAEKLPEQELADVVGFVISREIHERFVPLLDMANHAFDPGTRFGCDDQRRMCYLRLERDVKAGEEVRVEYDGYGNAQLLSIWGFKVDDNPYSTPGIPWPGAADVPKSCESLHPSFSLQHDQDSGLPKLAVPCFATAFITKLGLSNKQAWHHAELYALGGCLTLQNGFEKSENALAMKDLTSKAAYHDAPPTLKALTAAIRKDVQTVRRCVKVMNVSSAETATRIADEL